MAKGPVLTPRADDFPRWYQDVLQKAQLAENGPVRGTMVIRPYGYAIWERMQAEVDTRIKACGAENAYFPLFIPESYLQREAEHVEGFSPELAVVTIAGGKELEEPVVVRPTSETVIGEFMAKWIQSYRDLPLLLNQWANVVRWELRPRLFLRTSEFLWQEGHTAHVTEADAHAYADADPPRGLRRTSWCNVLAIPIVVGLKTPRERFAGATNTLTCEGMMGDGKALQMGTSHELGQNFARAFGIEYLDDAGTQQIGVDHVVGLVDPDGRRADHGPRRRRRPPRAAPAGAHPGGRARGARRGRRRRRAAVRSPTSSRAAGIRAQLDAHADVSMGRRATDWELKGVPVRLEVGPRDLADGVGHARAAHRHRRRGPQDRGAARRCRRCGHRGARAPAVRAARRRHRDARAAHRRRHDPGRRPAPPPPTAGPASPGTRWASTGRASSRRRASPCGAWSAPTAPCPTPSTSPSWWPSSGRAY